MVLNLYRVLRRTTTVNERVPDTVKVTLFTLAKDKVEFLRVDFLPFIRGAKSEMPSFKEGLQINPTRTEKLQKLQKCLRPRSDVSSILA